MSNLNSCITRILSSDNTILTGRLNCCNRRIVYCPGIAVDVCSITSIKRNKDLFTYARTCLQNRIVRVDIRLCYYFIVFGVTRHFYKTACIVSTIGTFQGCLSFCKSFNCDTPVRTGITFNDGFVITPVKADILLNCIWFYRKRNIFHCTYLRRQRCLCESESVYGN